MFFASWNVIRYFSTKKSINNNSEEPSQLDLLISLVFTFFLLFFSLLLLSLTHRWIGKKLMVRWAQMLIDKLFFIEIFVFFHGLKWTKKKAVKLIQIKTQFEFNISFSFSLHFTLSFFIFHGCWVEHGQWNE